jgi:hypothetical protein
MMIVSVMRSMDMPEFFSASVALWPIPLRLAARGWASATGCYGFTYFLTSFCPTSAP